MPIPGASLIVLSRRICLIVSRSPQSCEWKLMENAMLSKLKRLSVGLIKDITTAKSERSGFAILQEKLETFKRSLLTLSNEKRLLSYPQSFGHFI